MTFFRKGVNVGLRAAIEVIEDYSLPRAEAIRVLESLIKEEDGQVAEE